MHTLLRPILLAGPAGSGKDTAAQMLVQTFGGAINRLADPIRETLTLPAWRRLLDRLACREGDWDAAGAAVARRAQQCVGDAFRALDPNALVDLLVIRAMPDLPAIVVPDVRLPDELARLRAHWPDALAIYCDTPAPVRAARLLARDGIPLAADTAQHPTEHAGPALQAAVDWVWPNAGPIADTWPLLQAWVADHNRAVRPR